MKELHSFIDNSGQQKVFIDYALRKQINNFLEIKASNQNLGLIIAKDGFNVQNNTLSVLFASNQNLGIIIPGQNFNFLNETISLNTASYDSFGIIKAGTGYNLSNGVLSISLNSIATTQNSGFIKIGSNFTITNSILSVNTASTLLFGVIKVGSNFNVTNGTISVLNMPQTINNVVFSTNYLFSVNNLQMLMDNFSMLSKQQFYISNIDEVIISNDGIFSLDYSQHKTTYKICLVNFNNILNLILPRNDMMFPVIVDNPHGHRLYLNNSQIILKSYEKGIYILYFQLINDIVTLKFKRPLNDTQKIKTTPILNQVGVTYYTNTLIPYVAMSLNYDASWPFCYVNDSGTILGYDIIYQSAVFQINNGGTANVGVRSGGTIHINSGGTGNATYVYPSGTLMIHYGGITKSAIMNTVGNSIGNNNLNIEKGGCCNSMIATVNYCNINVSSGGAIISGQFNYNYNGSINISGIAISNTFIGGGNNTELEKINFYSGAYGSVLTISNYTSTIVNSGAKLQNITLSGINATYYPTIVFSSGAIGKRIWCDSNTHVYSSAGADVTIGIDPFNPVNVYLNNTKLISGRVDGITFQPLTGCFIGSGTSVATRAQTLNKNTVTSVQKCYVGYNGIATSVLVSGSMRSL